MNTTYEESKAINNSSLSYINPDEGGSPEKYHDYVMGTFKGDDTKALTLGDLVHKLILENIEPVMLDKVPSDTVKNIIDKALQYRKEAGSTESLSFGEAGGNTSIEDNKVFVLKAANELKYGKGNYKDDRIIKDIQKSGQAYWNFMLVNEGKDIVDAKTMSNITRIKLNLTQRPSVKEMFAEPQTSKQQLFLEKEIFWKLDVDGQIVECKSKLDGLLLDMENKTFSIRDLKTTSKSVQRFQNSFEYYRYYRQMAFYERAVMYRLEEAGFKGFKPADHYMVVVETTGYNLVRRFKVHRKYLEMGREEYMDLIRRILSHSKDQNWIFSREELENGGEFVLEPMEVAADEQED